MAAKVRDSQAGWNIYRQSNYTATLDEINSELVKRGFNPVAERTYTHYRKLHRYGYERYIPINQLDVETLREPIWVGPLRSRFRPHPAHLDVQLFFVVGEQLTAIPAETVELSEAEITVRLSDQTAETLVGAIEPPVEGRHVLIAFADTGETRSAVVELIAPDVGNNSSLMTLGLLAPVASRDELSGKLVLGPSSARVTMDSLDSEAPIVLLRRLYGLFEALDVARMVCDEVLAGLDPQHLFVLPPTQVTRLSLHSPLIVDLSIPTAVLLIVGGWVSRAEGLRKKHHQVNIVRGQANITDAQAAVLSEQARALRIKNDQDEFVAKIDRLGLIGYIQKLVKQSAPEPNQLAAAVPPALVDHIEGLVDRQLLPGLEKIFDETLQSIEVDSDLNIPPLPADGEPEDSSSDNDESKSH